MKKFLSVISTVLFGFCAIIGALACSRALIDGIYEVSCWIDYYIRQWKDRNDSED